MSVTAAPAPDDRPPPQYRYTTNGVPIDLDVWAEQLVATMPPLTQAQRARIRALFDVGGDEPQPRH